MSRHTYNKNKPSFINKTFWILVLICSGVVAYGVYVYIQDINESDRIRASRTSTSPENVQLTEEEEETENVPPETEEDAFEQLDDEIEASVKKNLVSSADETAGPDTREEMSINISFSSYNRDKQTYSLGVIFTNGSTETVSGCSLEIQTSPENAVTQTVASINQHNASGCRFNNIVLNGLTEPSNGNPWQVIVRGSDNSGNEITSLEREVYSLAGLDGLIDG